MECIPYLFFSYFSSRPAECGHLELGEAGRPQPHADPLLQRGGLAAARVGHADRPGAGPHPGHPGPVPGPGGHHHEVTHSSSRLTLMQHA